MFLQNRFPPKRFWKQTQRSGALIPSQNGERVVKNFSYIHVEKLREWGRGNRATREYKPNKYTRYWGVQGCWEHDMRISETANAISSRFAKNSIICSETG